MDNLLNCCGGRVHRRDLLRLAGAAGALWMTHAARLLAAEAPRRGPARSIIQIWLAGGPSQLETFDPHPGSAIAAGSKAIATRAPGVLLGEGLPRLAEQMDVVSLVRSLVSKEGDHERGQYYMKTGQRPSPAFEYPTLGAVLCSQTTDPGIEVPRHVSILPDGAKPAWGGALGPQWDAFQVGDPSGQLPDITPLVDADRTNRRLAGLDAIESAFAKQHPAAAKATRHTALVRQARRMMTSEQLTAFDVSQEPAEVRARYGDNPFGRGCLAARRLVEAGVRCIEVTLDGWDTHIENHKNQAARISLLDPALASLIEDLRQRDLLGSTVVQCGGEFGRSPRINNLDGRDHWPHNFTWAIAGGGIAGGRVLGETDPAGGKKQAGPTCTVSDIYATTLRALGLDPATEVETPIGRPIKLSDGQPLEGLLG